MAEDIKQIGARLRGLREVMDVSEEEMAEAMATTVEHYRRMEAGEQDPGVYGLQRVAKRYGVELDVLLFGEEPLMRGYFITRRGKGLTVERNANYGYEGLAAGFKGRRIDPFLTVIDPLPEGHRRQLNSHEGQEFDYILEGALEITIGTKTTVLYPGDSIYFDSSHPHCMHATGDTACRMLVIVI